MKRSLLIVLMLLGLGLVACGGGSDTAVSEEAIDVSSLPDDVDVQTVADIMNNDDVFVIDVREQWEYDEGHLPGITLIPMNEIPNRLDEIPEDKEVIVTCRSGNRSGQITNYLREQGYDNIHNMEGGILAWEAAGLPVE